jgi:hypothetical protein
LSRATGRYSVAVALFLPVVTPVTGTIVAHIIYNVNRQFEHLSKFTRRNSWPTGGKMPILSIDIIYNIGYDGHRYPKQDQGGKMELDQRYKSIMVKRAIWQRLRLVAAFLESERRVNVSRGDVVVAMLDTLYPGIQVDESPEEDAPAPALE